MKVGLLFFSALLATSAVFSKLPFPRLKQRASLPSTLVFLHFGATMLARLGLRKKSSNKAEVAKSDSTVAKPDASTVATVAATPTQLCTNTETLYGTEIHEVVKVVCKSLENRLERDFGAFGETFHDKISSVDDVLSPLMVQKLNYLASFYNRKKTGSDPMVINRYIYINTFEEVKHKLKWDVRRRVAGDSASQKCMLGIIFIAFVLSIFPIKVFFGYK